MLHKNMSKSEIEEELKGMGDFIKIDYLTKFSKETLPIDIKKFIYLKLAEIYEKVSMFESAARSFNDVALISIAFSEKIKYYVKEAELYIKTGHFERVDQAINKARNEANASQKAEIYFVIKEFYKKQAQIYEKEMRRNKASTIYEKLFQMKISEQEKQEIKEKLLDLYEKLGKFKEHSALKNIE